MSRTKSASKPRLSSTVAETVVSSRYNDPGEFAVMERALATLRPGDRRAIASLACNSKNGWHTATMTPDVGQRDAARIGETLHRALVAASGGYYVMLSIEAGWRWLDFDGGGGPDEEPDPPVCTCGCCFCCATTRVGWLQ